MFFDHLLLAVFCLGIKVFSQIHAEEVELREVAADKGTNVTIPCNGLVVLSAPNVQWVHRGNHTHHEILLDGSLFIPLIGLDDAGLYECGVENETAFLDRINLTVHTEPPPLVNVTVHASTILALILWNVAGDGGHPIIDFTAQYRSATPVNGTLEAWRPISPNHISPNSRQVDVYHLEPNASYWFRVWATNVLGAGPPVEVLATTLYSDQEAELYKHFLDGSETFDTRTWVVAVCVVMGTLLVLAAGTCVVLCREWRRAGGGRENPTSDFWDYISTRVQTTGLSRRVWSWLPTLSSTQGSWRNPAACRPRAQSWPRRASRSRAAAAPNRAASDSQSSTAGYSSAPTRKHSPDPTAAQPTYPSYTFHARPCLFSRNITVYKTI